MISRRNIRVKVMQTLYTLYAADGTPEASARRSSVKMLEEKLDRTIDLFYIAVLYVFRVARYAEKDARNRAAKYLPTEEDRHVSTKISENEFMLALMEDPHFSSYMDRRKIERNIDDSRVRKLYQRLVQTAEYKGYARTSERDATQERAILRFTWERLFLADEAEMEYFEDEFPGWDDDREMITQLMENLFKGGKPINWAQPLSEEKREYASELLGTVVEKESYCMELIQPRLINWEADRVALIDLLLLRMGICELLYFPTIPVRVTINEYIEIAKLYSTLQSGQFVNGVLDNIMKTLEAENKIVKKERNKK